MGPEGLANPYGQPCSYANQVLHVRYASIEEGRGLGNRLVLDDGYELFAITAVDGALFDRSSRI